MRNHLTLYCRSCTTLLGIAILLSAAAAPAQTTLRWKFTKGQVFNQVITQDTKQSMVVGGKPYDTMINQNIEATWTVGDVDAQGIAQVTQEIKRIRMKMSGITNIEVDSASNEQPQGLAASIAPSVKALSKAKFETKMDPQGKILEVEVNPETLEQMKALPNAAQLNVLRDSLVSTIKQGGLAMSKEPVQKGASWPSTMEVNVPQLGKMIAKVTLTYVGPETVAGKQLERLDIDVATKLEAGGGAKAFEVSVKDEKSKGQLYFDNNAGRIDHSNLVQDMTMQVAVGDNKFDQKVQTTVNVVFEPAPAAKP